MPRAIFGNSRSCFPWQPISSLSPFQTRDTHIERHTAICVQRDQFVYVCKRTHTHHLWQVEICIFVNNPTETCNSRKKKSEPEKGGVSFSNLGVAVSTHPKTRRKNANVISNNIKGGYGKGNNHTHGDLCRPCSCSLFLLIITFDCTGVLVFK